MSEVLNKVLDIVCDRLSVDKADVNLNLLCRGSRSRFTGYGRASYGFRRRI